MLPKPDGATHYRVNERVTLPVGVSGSYYFFVTITPTSGVTDVFLSNDVGHDAGATVVHLTPPPDLTVSDVSSNGTAIAGHDLTITYRVINTGATTTPNTSWYDALYLSTDNVLGAGDIKLSEVVHSGSLDPAGSDAELTFTQALNLSNSGGATGYYINTVTLHLADTLVGDYYLIAAVDNSNAVFELDNANNVSASAAPITIESHPADLVVSSLTAPSAVQSGSTMRVSWTVQNEGVGETTTSQWTDNIILSRDSILGGWDDIWLGSAVHSGALGAGGSYSNSALVSLPRDISGDYQIFVQTDAYHQVYEDNAGHNAEENNSNSLGAEGLQIQPEPTADLQVSAVTVPSTVESGDYLAVSYSVTNAGIGRTNSEYWRDDVILSQDATFGNSDDVLLGSIYHANRLAPNENYTGTGSFKVPLDLQGNYHIWVYADAGRQVIESGPESNNQQAAATSTSVTLTPTPDLAITSLQAANAGVSGQYMHIDWTVHNSGAAIDNQWWGQVLYLSRDGFLDRNSDIYLGNVWGEAIGSGEDATFSQSFRIPNGIGGKYYVFAVVDSYNSIYERDGEGNNVTMDSTAVQITKPDPVDLVAGLITIPVNGTPGSDASITYTVTNLSALSLSGQWKDNLYISKDATWDVGDILFGRVDVYESLAANESYSQTVTGSLPGVIGGDYYVIVRSDIYNQVLETNESNNLKASVDKMHVDVEKLELGTPDSASIANGAAVYYRIEVAAGETLKIDFDRVSTNGRTEFYVSYGEMPSRSTADYRYTRADSPDQTMLIPNTKAGSYYVMAYNADGAASNYSISANALQFSISEIGTNEGSRKGDVTVRIQGAKMTVDTVAKLVDANGVEHAASKVYWKDSTEIWATFDLRTMTAGTCDLKIQDGQQTDTLTHGFTVNDAEVGHLEFNMETPSALRSGQIGSVRVYYKNTGETDVVAPVLKISGNALLKLPSDAAFGGTTLELLGVNTDGPAGILAPGAEGSVQLFFKADFAGAGSVNLSLAQIDPGKVVDWDKIIDASKPEDVSQESWNLVKANLIAELGHTAADCQNNLSVIATYLDQLEGRTSDITRLLNLDVLKATSGGALLQPLHLGVLGYSQTFTWDITAVRQSDGSVIVKFAGIEERFNRQADGTYKLDGQGSATLIEASGAFEYLEKNGTAIFFNIDGTFSELRNANNQSVSATWTDGQLVKLVTDNGHTLDFEYNAAGRLVKQTDEAGRITTYSYDAGNQHLLSIASPDGTTGYSYVATGAAQNQVSSFTLPDGTVHHFTYDSTGHLTSEYVNDHAETVSYSYVGVNEVVVTDALNHSSHLWMNAQGQIAQVEDALGHVSQLRYDASGNLTGVVNADGTTSGITYDATGNPISVDDALGYTIGFAYDQQFGKLSESTDQLGHKTDYSYDSNGNLNGITYADNSKETYTYDSNGNLHEAVNGRSQKVTYTFDANGHLTQKAFVDGTHADFTYDSNGHLASATDADSSTTFSYDAAGHLLKVTDNTNSRWLEYTYDAAGRRTEMVDQAGHETHYSYDALGHLSRVSDEHNATVALYSYDAAGRLVTGVNGNGTYTEYTYDAAGHVTHLVNYQADVNNNHADDTVNSSFDYTYDAMGRRTSMTDKGGVTNYDYDADGQLTGVTLPTGRHIEYHYDAAGNRTIVNDSGASESYVANSMNEYTSAGSATFTYDADGNMASKTEGGVTTSFAYDAESHLVSVTAPGDSWSYEYDALGNRIASVHNGERTEFLVDPTGLTNVASEYDGTTNSLKAAYTWGIGLESQTNTDGSYYYDFNATGSTTGITGSIGTYVNTYNYLPFGEEIAKNESIANSFEYVGQWGVTNEGNGLDLMGARYYSASEGRFVQQDPTGISGGINLYSYAGNSPVIYIDPTGLVIAGQVASGALNVAVGTVAVVGIAGAMATVSAPALAILGTVAVISATYKASVGVVQVVGGLADAQIPIEGNMFGDMAGLTGNQTAKSVGKVVDLTLDLSTGRALGAVEEVFWGIKATATTFEKTKWTLELTDAAKSLIESWYDYFNPPAIGKTVPIVVPRDPNDIIGPQSFGDAHWTSGTAALPYTIHFENQASATAPAQEVTITQTLDSDLNPASFRLGTFGWGGEVHDEAEGAMSFTYRYEDTAAKGYYVDVFATIDVAKGEVTWKFTTIDPDTGEIPEDPTIGFLLPDIDGKIGQGFVNYTVHADSGAATGTVIDSSATVIFTTQEPIDTPAIFSTLDKLAPESHVDATQDNATLDSAQFLVHWSGTDDGSAIASYTIYVSDNGGEYVEWLKDTTLSEASYAGEAGHTYAFYSIASDNAGNKEAVPATPDLTINVSANAVLNDIVLPEVASVVLPPDGLYATGQTIDFEVHFSEKVIVEVGGAPPAIRLTVGDTQVDAAYQSGSGTDTLVFRHTVSLGEFDNDGIVIGGSIVLNGSSVRDIAGNYLADTSISTAATAGIKVGNAPVLQNAITAQAATEDQTFSFLVPTGTFFDPDTQDTLTYAATLADGSALPGWLSFNAGTHTFSGTPANDNVGEINVKVIATDTSLASAFDTFKITVENVNDLPTGGVTITGTAAAGSTLTAHNTLADDDGLGQIGYHWMAGGAVIGGATSATYTLTDSELGKTVTVVASYQDLRGHNESVESAHTGVVIDNTPPTLTGSTPADGAVKILTDSSLELTFSEAIHLGSGAVVLHSGAVDGPAVASTLSVIGNKLTVDPTSALDPGTHYYLTFEAHSIDDLAGNSYTAGADGYDFTTKAIAHDITLDVTYWKSGAEVAGATGTLTDSEAAQTSGVTGADGHYTFDAVTDGNYTLSADKVVSGNDGGAVNALDALAALKIAIGQNPNAGDAPISSYQYLASDIDKNGLINALDALNILKMALALPGAQQNDWVVVSDSTGNVAMNNSSVTWPAGGIPISLEQDQDLHLVGVLMGDVNGSWTPA
jgi:RHS repeat-associated protein